MWIVFVVSASVYAAILEFPLLFLVVFVIFKKLLHFYSSGNALVTSRDRVMATTDSLTSQWGQVRGRHLVEIVQIFTRCSE
jgi:hypothetical protein